MSVVRFVVGVVAGLVAAVAAVGIVFFVGMRSGSPRVLDAVRRVNKRFTNPKVLQRAGTAGQKNAVVRHVGRTSGRAYETPIVPFPTLDGYVVALPYGLRADWAKNVLAAGAATLLHDGREVAVERPELVPTASVLADLPASEQRTLRRFKVEQCLRLHLAAVPA